MDRVLVAVDGSEAGWAALEHALERHPDARLVAVHVPETSTFSLDAGSTALEDARERGEEVLSEAEAVADERGRSIETDLAFGPPAKALVGYAEDEDVDAVVVGSRGRSGATRLLLGSTAETVVRRAPCPVTIAR